MRSTLRSLKDNKKELINYANLLGINGSSWNEIMPYLVISQSAVVKNADGTKTISIPESCLNNSARSKTTKKLFEALFQPRKRFLSDRIMFSPSFNSMVCKLDQTDKPPVITKGVSYPSSLQKTRSEEINNTDNVWLIDLFTWGKAYSQYLEFPESFFIVDTTIYEGWNRFTETDLRKILSDLPKGFEGPSVVERFLDALKQPKYKFILSNSKIRNAYLQAISEVLNLPTVISMTEIMTTSFFLENLTQAIQAVNPNLAFSFEGDTNARDFTPFVYAEELALRKILNAGMCTGPLREDLPLNLDVLRLYQLTDQKPTIVSWYSRPGKFPNLTFRDDKDKVITLLTDPKYENLKYFIIENLIKAELLNDSAIYQIKMAEIAEIFSNFMKDVNNIADKILSE